jgi:SAM-dependent methyltransferase
VALLLEGLVMGIRRIARRLLSPPPKVEIEVSRGDQRWAISPEQFESFPFHDGDHLAVMPEAVARELPVTWGDTHVPISPGRAIRVPAKYGFAEFKGFRIPHHLVALTGAGPETLGPIGKAHVEKYERYVGLFRDMVILDLGCGIGRDAFQLVDYLSESGQYIGIDVTRDSILWCQKNITPKYPQFAFHHADAVNELYNPFGTLTSQECRLPADDDTVDRIVLASVFTHLLEDEVIHYMQEFRRVLKPAGRVYASFFLYSPEAVEAAKIHGNTLWKATFEHQYGDGVYGNDPVYPRGAVAYTDAAMQRMLNNAGLRLMRPYLKGWWSGLHGDQAEDGQDVAILAPIN